MDTLKAARFYWILKNRLQSFKTYFHSKMFDISFNSSNCLVHPNCEVYGLNNIQIGKSFKAREGLWLHAIKTYENQIFEPSIVIGDNVAGSKHLHIAAIESIKIGNNVLFGSNVLITDHNHGAYARNINANFASRPSTQPRKRLLSGSPVVIEDNVFIGDGVMILPGSYIEEGAVVGCGSVVNGHIKSSSIAAGTPAKIKSTYNWESSSWE